MDDFLQAWRGLRHSPGFLMLASVVLALGLGVTIYTYAVINATTRKPPPFPEAERLYEVFVTEPARGDRYNALHFADFLELQNSQRAFEEVAAHYSGTAQITFGGRAARYTGETVTWRFMRVLGVQPFLGRDFTAEDDSQGAAPTVLLSYDLWRARFGGDEEIVGRVIRVNAVPTTVIGVMPKTFELGTDLWLPMASSASRENRADKSFESSVGVGVIGRLARGITPEQAQQDVAAIFERLAALYPQTNAGMTANVVPVAEAILHDARGTVDTLFASTLLVLLVACANVASLLFVRANLRVYEAGMRVALGARRPRLIIQMLAESLIVAAFGVVGGLVLASIGLHLTDVAVRSFEEARAPLWWQFSIDARVATFAIGAALVSALLAGIAPAIRASRPDLMRILRDGGRTGTGMRLNKFTTAMVVVEIALSASLLTSAGIMTRASVLSLQPDYGADVSGFMSARVGLPLAKYPEVAQGRFFERLTAELRTRPGVLSAVAATTMPGSGAEEWSFAVQGENYETREEYPRGHLVAVTTGFFDAFRLPLIAGREFTAADQPDTPHVAVVNQVFAERHFPNESPLGKLIHESEDTSSPPITIVGVAPNINHDKGWKSGGFVPTIYRPVAQLPWRFLTVAVRTEGEPHAYGALLRSVTQQLDADLAPYWVKTLEEFQIQRRDATRLLSNVFTGFAFIAVALAGVGIYGVLAFATGQRNREIGVRRALGARDRQILIAVMRGALVQLLIGLALGALLAPVLARALQDAFAGISPDDPAVFGIVVALLVAAALLASWLPARRALRVQPSSVLRCE